MSFNINNFKTNTDYFRGLSRTSHFEVFIPTNQIDSSMSPQGLSLMAESATLPGIGYQTNEIRQTGYGVTEKKPNLMTFIDTQINFLVDSDGKVLDFFHRWASMISPFQGGADDYLFEYPINYMTDIEVTQFAPDGIPINTYRFIRAYPLNILPIQMAWQNQNEVSRLTVDFTYHSWIKQ